METERRGITDDLKAGQWQLGFRGIGDRLGRASGRHSWQAVGAIHGIARARLACDSWEKGDSGGMRERTSSGKREDKMVWAERGGKENRGEGRSAGEDG
ncbi:hypothetical protein E2562_038599 [Oryza meyeriana var. granulata]|uniref:Uncharacterized protein n=1 Tax=Oryza meyeriana var. granulata TaxID=110450 RepID=A0A6G1CCK3_9ORYZ|nr:hypothetical protein E2562_038599 [Oryza meyeriana var. granulata]